MMNLFYRSVNIGHELIFLKRQFFLICLLFLNWKNSTCKLPTDIISGGELEFFDLRENPVQRVGFLYAILLAGRDGSMGVRGAVSLGCRLLYAARGARLALLGHILRHIVHVLGERGEFDIHSVLL